jgi:hypothetical protein
MDSFDIITAYIIKSISFISTMILKKLQKNEDSLASSSDKTCIFHPNVKKPAPKITFLQQKVNLHKTSSRVFVYLALRLRKTADVSQLWPH